ncbi:AAA family ATPase [Polyangium aurulentum]|uniref:AAA family ATPase n=1 Tax=Polyangium aurulentum TaxID=2567896 RepID=UPI00146A90A9|nr:ATP-binding protein [Polyangium aurulentum]UQA57283.1 ATP-binding protein [Polyangium aurulentum]
MPTAHLICGSTGAGKTTYSLALAERLGAIRFSIDDWMATLFVPDWPPTPDLSWALERTARCEAQMWRMADQLLARGVDVIFDVGLSKREHRDRFRARAAQAGVPTRLHFLDVDAEVRRARVHQRNAEKIGSYSFEVNDEMFDFMETYFERPSADELVGAEVISGSERG